MSRYKNAPLIEVLLELFWGTEEEGIPKGFDYLHGELYSNVKEQYPNRETIYPEMIPPLEMLKHRPVYRFRKSINGYPLIQVGPGLVTINTVDSSYDWDDFVKEIQYTILALNNSESFVNKIQKLRLTYFDFIEINFEENSLFRYLSENFNLNIQQNIISNPDDLISLNTSFTYKVSENIVVFTLRKAEVKGKVGIWMETAINSDEKEFDLQGIIEWATTAHELCKKIFDKTFDGPMLNKIKGI